MSPGASQRTRALAALLAVAPVALVMCASATEIDVDVYSEVDCGKHAEVGLVVGGELTDLGGNAASSTSINCDASQRVGRVVLSPSGSNDEEIAFQVVTRNDDQGVETCTAANNYSGCIVARRQLHFSPHKALDVRVDLRLSCLDNPCDPTSTCVRGICVAAACPASGCPDESSLTSAPGIDGGMMGTPDTGAPDASDAGACNPPAADGTVSPATIVANAGTIPNPSGLAQQNHLFFAKNDCRYWYFAPSSSDAQILTYSSTDLRSWTAGPAISIATGVENMATGADFSVAYVNVNGGDVFHIVTDQPTGATGYAYDYRVTLANGAFSTPIPTQVIPPGIGLDGGDCIDSVDGPSIAVDQSGFVYVATGWTYRGNGTHCDMNVYRSADAETGQGWATTFAQSGYFITAHYTTDHLLLTLPNAGKVIGSFLEPETNGGTLLYTSVAWLTDVASPDAGEAFTGQYPTNTIFNGTKQHHTNDWSVCAVSDTEIHAMRHNTDGSFEAATWNGSSWAPDANNPMTVTSPANAGVVIMSDDHPSHGLTAFVITDAGATISSSRYLPTAPAWTAWAPVAALTGAVHDGLAGSGCGRAHPTLVWTETTSRGIGAADVSSLFTP